MKKFLKNYTSDVPVSESIRRIEHVLLQCGVTGIMKEYAANQKIVAITFRVTGEDGKPWMIRLPAKEQEATDALFLMYADGDQISKDGQSVCNYRKKLNRKDFVAQGERTAWRIVKDWIEVEMSRIQLKQGDIMEVFLSYTWDGKRTYYEALKESNYAGLLQQSSSDTEEIIEGEFISK